MLRGWLKATQASAKPALRLVQYQSRPFNQTCCSLQNMCLWKTHPQACPGGPDLGGLDTPGSLEVPSVLLEPRTNPCQEHHLACSW